MLGLVFWAIGERARRRGITGIAAPGEFLTGDQPPAAQAP